MLLALLAAFLVAVTAQQNCPKYMKKDITIESISPEPKPEAPKERRQITKFETELADIYPQLKILQIREDSGETIAKKPRTKWFLKVAKNANEVSMLHLRSTYSIAQRWRMSEHANRTAATSHTHMAMEITELNPQLGEWYMVCVKQNLIADAVLTSCYQCNLVKAGGPITKITTRLVQSSITEAKLYYDVTDYPLTTSKVQTQAVEMKGYARCATAMLDHRKPEVAAQVKNPILPNSITEAILEGLDPMKSYRINSQLILNHPEAYDKMKIPVDVLVTCDIFDQPGLTIPRACEDHRYEY